MPNNKFKAHLNRCLIIAAACFVVYSYSLKGGFLWDDETLILNNASLRSNSLFSLFLRPLSSEFSAYYRPLQMLSYKLDYLVWGLNPFGFHLSSIIIHILNSLLVYAVVFIIGANLGTAFLTGLVFSIHPLFSEPVNYISSRPDLLLGFFLLLALIFYLKKKANFYSCKYFYISLGCFLAAILSKETALIFPLLLLAYAYITGREEKKSLVFYCVVAVLYILIRAFLLPGHQRAVANYQFAPLVLTDITVIATYLRLIFLPFGLHKNWVLPVINSTADWRLVFSFLTLAAIVVFCRLTWKRNKLFTFGALWFFICLSPTLNLVLFPLLGLAQSFGKVVFSEAWAYFASIGIILAIFSLAKRTELRPMSRVLYVIFALIISFYSALTIKQNRLWAGDAVYFYSDLLRYHPFNAVVRYNLANAYSELGRYDKAIEEYKIALALKPNHLYARNNLCDALMRSGKLDEAIAECKEVIKAAPNLYKAYYNLGKAYFQKGSYRESLEAYEKALELEPNFKEALQGWELARQKLLPADKD